MRNMLAAIAAFFALALGVITGALAQVPPSNYVTSQTLASAVTATGAQASVRNANLPKTYQVKGTTSSGAGSAIVNIEGSNDNVNWDILGTITLTLGTSSTSGSFSSLDHYLYVRANATTLTGTGASYTAVMGY